MGNIRENGFFSSPDRAARKNLSEEINMNRILLEYKDRRGWDFDLVPVGGVGWILQRKDIPTPRASPGIVINFDVDDTFLRSSEVKKERIRRYKDHLHDRQIDVPDADIDKVMQVTYDFVQANVGRGSYLSSNHAVVLDWVTTQFQRGETTGGIQDTLDRIKERGVEADDPFRVVDGTIIPTNPSPEIPVLRRMFRDTLTDIAPFQESVDAFIKLAEMRGQGENIHINLFTQGNPPEQLLKVLGLMERNPRLLPDQILITKDYKDKFTTQLIDTGAMNQLPPASVAGQGGENEYLFGRHDHVVVDVDDSTQSLDTKVSVVPFVAERTGARITRFIRIRRSEAKDGWKDWAGQGDNVEIDLRVRPDEPIEPMSGDKLAAIILAEGRSAFEGRGRVFVPAPRSDQSSHVRV